VPKILIVEDDPAVRDVVNHALSREGMATVAVEDGEAALERLRREAEPFDLVVLDIMLPGMDGISVCREIRTGEAGSASSEVPVVMLTARDDEINVVVGLEVGADDYITKPFRPSELVGRVRAHLRRRRIDLKSATDEQRKLEFPGLELDLPRRQVFVGGKPVALTAKEFEVLELLASHPGWVYSREQIMRHLYGGGEFFGEARAADVHVQHIRKKIEADPKNPRYVQTIRGFGYKFAEL
jgi:two-component system, OmpR family, alkaline phosphatase synthesis response regulator PhoP